MLRDRMYHSLLQYPPSSLMHHQARLHADLLAIKENELINNELDRRKLFHNFVAEKTQQAKLMGLKHEQMDYRQYLGRIDRLRKEREQLGRDKMLCKLASTYNTDQHLYFQSDHIVKPKSQLSKPATPQPVHLSESLKKTLIQPSHFKIENQKTFAPSYKYKGKLAHHITNRWVPPHLQTQNMKQAIRDKERNENERWFGEIQNQMNQIRNRINIRKQKSQINEQQVKRLEDGIRSHSVNRYKHQIEEKKHVSFNNVVINNQIENERNNRDQSQLKEKKQDNYEKLHRSYLQIRNKNPYIKDYQTPINDDKNTNQFNDLSQKNSPKNIKQKKKKQKQQFQQNQELDKHGQEKLTTAIQKIKNRLTLSMIVYEDSQHRTINHQKAHLANKYENECKQRKDLVGKICGAKCVANRYNLIIT